MKNRIYLQGFENQYPFIPTCKEVIYLPFSGSQVIDSFFERNIDSVKELFREKLKYEFIFIPEKVKRYGDEETLKYFHPLADKPSLDRKHIVEQELLNGLLHNDDGKSLRPGLVHFMQTELFREFEGEHKGCFEFSYFPLIEADDATIMASLRDYVELCGECYGHINYGHPDIWQYSEADRSFYSAQEKYFKQYANKDIKGITRYIIDSLVDKIAESHIEVSENGDIKLTDYGLAIDMCPVVKAVYILFLSHHEGIILADLPEYLEEMAHICPQLNICYEDDLNVIALSLNPELDIIDQLCGEIYVAFRDKLDAKAAAPYIIQASPYDPDKSYMMPYLDMGEPKKIILDRSLVNCHSKFNFKSM